MNKFVYCRPYLGHKIRFFLKRDAQLVKEQSFTLKYMVKNAALAIFIFAVTITTFITIHSSSRVEQNLPEILKELDAEYAKGQAIDIRQVEFINRTRKVKHSASQLEQARFNVLQLGIEEFDEPAFNVPSRSKRSPRG